MVIGATGRWSESNNTLKAYHSEISLKAASSRWLIVVVHWCRFRATNWFVEDVLIENGDEDDDDELRRNRLLLMMNAFVECNRRARGRRTRWERVWSRIDRRRRWGHRCWVTELASCRVLFTISSAEWSCCARNRSMAVKRRRSSAFRPSFSNSTTRRSSISSILPPGYLSLSLSLSLLLSFSPSLSLTLSFAWQTIPPKDLKCQSLKNTKHV